jgi:DNA mismatch repair protein MSH6
VLRELATKTLPLTLFATHYSSLTDMGEKHPNIRNMTMQTVVDDEKRQVSNILDKLEYLLTRFTIARNDVQVH